MLLLAGLLLLALLWAAHLASLGLDLLALSFEKDRSEASLIEAQANPCSFSRNSLFHRQELSPNRAEAFEPVLKAGPIEL